MNRPSNLSRTAAVRRLSLVLLLLGLNWTQSACAQSYVLTSLWSITPKAPGYSFLSNDNLSRGLAYNPVSGHVLVVSRTSSNAVYILNGADGTVLGTLPYGTGVISGGNFAINMIGVTDDGVIYVGNLTTDATGGNGPFKLYRWADESAPPQLAYSGDPSAGNLLDTYPNPRRFGDSLAVRGTGTNTQILLGTYHHIVGLLRTPDGTNFTATRITTLMSWPGSDSRWGLAWGAGDSFWVKQAPTNYTTHVQPIGNLRKLSLDLVNSNAVTVNNVNLPGALGGPLDVDVSRNLLAIIDTTSHSLRLYDIFDPSNPIQQDTTRSFPTNGANAGWTGAVALRNGKLFALESNNGILAYSLQETSLPATITGQPASVMLWEGATYSITAVYGGTRPFTYQWRLAGTNIPGATASSLVISNISFDKQGAYSVAVSNSLGGAISANATLTVSPANASAQVTNLWNVLAGTRPYLTYRPVGDNIAGYRGYGLAINPVTTNIIIVARQDPTNMIVVLDIQGNYLHHIDYSSLNLSMLANPMNRVDVADDGVVYVGNLVSDATTNPYRVYSFSDDSASPTEKFLAYSGDPANGAANPNVWGHTFSVRGSGLNTEILIGSAYSTFTNFAILRPDVNYAFSSTLITVSGAPAGFGGLGLDWGPGTNTVWGKTTGGQLYLIQYDLGSGTGTVLNSYPLTMTVPSALRFVPSAFTGLKYDPATELLAGLQNCDGAETPAGVLVYDASDPGAGPFLVDQDLFPTYNSDVEFTGLVDFGNGYLAALGVNNGLMISKVNPESVRLPRILVHPLSATAYRGTAASFSVVADSTLTGLSYEWYHNGEIVTGETNATLALSNVETNQAGVYTARVSNAGGFRDSAPATLTVIGPFKILDVTPAPGSVTLRWEAVSTATYQVQRAATVGGGWTDLGSVITATGDTASYTDTDPDPNMRFYRVLAK